MLSEDLLQMRRYGVATIAPVLKDCSVWSMLCMCWHRSPTCCPFRSSPGYAPRGRDRDLVGSGSGFSAPRSRDFTPRGPDHQPRDRGYSARSSQQDYRAPKDRDFGGPGRDRGPSQREFRDYGGARDRGDYGTSRVERREYSSRSYGGGPPAPSDYRDYQAQPISRYLILQPASSFESPSPNITPNV